MLKISEHSIEEQIGYENLYSLRSLRTPRGGKLLAWFLLGFLLLFLIILFLPWQQNIRGQGNVTALSPMNRPQTIEAVIAGRVQKWYVNEGDLVQKGDTIVTISEVKEKYFDPQLLLRLRQQIIAKENSLKSKDQKANALIRQIDALHEAMKLKIEQSTAKLEAENVNYQNAENQFQRNKKLYEAGNIPLTKYQEFEYKFQGSQAAYLNAKIELDRVAAEYLDKISKAESELNNTRSEAFETQAEIAKARNELVNTEIRNTQYQILAPQDGFIVKTLKAGIAETIKEGDAICTIMPQTSDVAVEMYVKAMDVPLISKGRKVRVQFDGWPALQFSGWPSVSVGTFGGEVRVIDYVNSKPGEFRILVVPDETEQRWPEQIRVGSGTKGWVMLDNVPVWYELWRQLNGFPPSLYRVPLNETIAPDQSKAK
ncbi:MAG: HlyD family secretion protein [Cyclobacteriaceae bacterium]|nr:HlyD family secretion protein [Cyclobacteriaceae bacterium]